MGAQPDATRPDDRTAMKHTPTVTTSPGPSPDYPTARVIATLRCTCAWQDTFGGDTAESAQDRARVAHTRQCGTPARFSARGLGITR